MTEPATAGWDSDRPLTSPERDIFEQAPFAKLMAKALQKHQGSDGIVIALHGPWGSGKSTVLAFVQRELEQFEPAEQPVVVNFNPSWFSGHENLAKAFLEQMQVILPAKYHNFRKIGELLKRYSKVFGIAAESTLTSMGLPGSGPIVEKGLKAVSKKLAPDRPVDVPGLKKELSDLLFREKKRVLVIVDDIDRLSPDEVRQLFTVIKALADFPYVTYLLAFDREVAVRAIDVQTGLPGDRYLEKIIQVSFELPIADRTTLRLALDNRIRDLERVMNLRPLPTAPRCAAA